MREGNENKIVITGAGGFLGNNLVNALAGDSEYSVYALSSRADLLQQEKNSNIQFLHKDIIFIDEGAQILKNAIIINCAFPRNTDGFELADGMRYIQKLFDKSSECDVKAIINISSQSVYSQYRESPATEETPVCLESTYALGKYTTELMLEMVCKKNSIDYTNLRMSSLIGVGFNQRIINKLISKALAGEPITIVQSKRIFGFLDVRDAINAILSLIMISPGNWESIYNVGNGAGYTLIDIYQTIKKVFLRHDIPFPETHFEYEECSISSSVSGERLFKDSGFNAKFSLEESVESILQAMIVNS